MTNGHFTTAIKICRGKWKVKWKEGENDHQGGSNETEDRKEAVIVNEREEQGVNELRVIRDIPSCTTRSSPEKHLQNVQKKIKGQTRMYTSHQLRSQITHTSTVQVKHPMTHTPDTKTF